MIQGNHKFNGGTCEYCGKTRTEIGVKEDGRLNQPCIDAPETTGLLLYIYIYIFN